MKTQKSKKLRHAIFFSYSSVDYNEIQHLIGELNRGKKNVYCDWINDNDYLKRNLVGLASRTVIETRIEQSEAIVLVISEHSMQSKWVKYELNYAYELNKPIYTIRKEDILGRCYFIDKLIDLWFLEENYKNIIFFESNQK